MTVELTPDQQQVVGEAIRAGLIQLPDDVLNIGVAAIRQRLEESQRHERLLTAEEWSQEFHAWVRSHSTDTPLLSDEAITRDSIYGTHGQ